MVVLKTLKKTDLIMVIVRYIKFDYKKILNLLQKVIIRQFFDYLNTTTYEIIFNMQKLTFKY